tara:strand:- start:362 stop:469 length:108 start_codon:yes stop_codon:yes gene_type:complete
MIEKKGAIGINNTDIHHYLNFWAQLDDSGDKTSEA